MMEAGNRLETHRAFLAHYKAIKHPLYNYFFFRCGGQRELAEDLTQETVLKAYRAFASYRSTHQFSTWIYTIARNVLIDHLRKRKGEVLVGQLSDEQEGGLDDFEDQHTTDVYRSFDDANDLSRIQTAMASLPEKHAQCIRLRYTEELSDKEISERLHMTPESVRQNISRGIRTLRTMILSIIFIFTL